MGSSPAPPKMPTPPPPPPNVFDQQVRSAKAAQRDSTMAARGRKRTLLTSPLGDTSTPPTLGGTKTLLGQ